MYYNLQPKWKGNDFTAEDLIYSKPGESIKIITEEDQVNQLIFTTGSMHTICSSLRAWSPNDYTNKETSLADVCTFSIRQATSVTPNEIDLTGYLSTSQIRLDVEMGDVEKVKTPIIQDIYDIYRECAEDNWDGYGAKRISVGAYLEAMKLAELIPTEFPLPEVSPEPSGDIAFEWYKGKRFLIVLSVEGNNIINYAGLFGSTNRIYGSEYFSDGLPTSVLRIIQRLFL